jgi:hypothetical protein
MTRPKNLALQKIESHEKLCRIMQKQTHQKIEKLETSIERIERILIGCAGYRVYYSGDYNT